MNRTEHAIYEVDQLHMLAMRDQWMNRIHPLVKFVLTLLYLVATISFHKYDVMGLLGMMVYPLALFLLGDLSFRDSLYRLRFVLPLVFLMGIFNPFFDTNRIVLGGATYSAGWLSMVTLILKGCFCIFASYALIATTTIEEICYALRMLHVPKVLVNQFLLTYRYISLFLGEVHRTTQAYHLRAPKQKGIHISAWGSLVGQMLLRCIDRASEVYESMVLRGYHGEFYLQRKTASGGGSDSGGITAADLVYAFLWLAVIVLFRIFPVLVWIGNLTRGMI